MKRNLYLCLGKGEGGPSPGDKREEKRTGAVPIEEKGDRYSRGGEG